MLATPIGWLVQKLPKFPRRGQLLNHWIGLVAQDAPRKRYLPGGSCLVCDMAVPYEAMVWLQQEEEEDLRVLRKLLRVSDTFVDCGANVGLWSLTAAEAVGPPGKVYAFEPNPLTRAKLIRNVQANPQAPVLVQGEALGREPGEVFLQCPASHNDSRVVAQASPDTQAVTMTTLDVALGAERVAGCKIDVEGLELDLLLGAGELLARCRPWLAIEFNPLLAGTEWLREWPVHRHLTALGYTARQFSEVLATGAETVLPDDWRTHGYCNLFYSCRG